jgi:hypothetical protein
MRDFFIPASKKLLKLKNLQRDKGVPEKPGRA